MAFPDYGAIKLYSTYTQEGFERGSYLFKLISGGYTDGLALHYIAISMAMVGLCALLLIPALQKAKIIGSWLLLVFILLVYPTNNPVFFSKVANKGEIQANGSGTEQNQYTHAFTPQALAVDILSRLHRVIFVSFYTVGSDNQINIIDYASSLDSKSPFLAFKGTTFSSRPDLLQERFLYKSQCGNMAELTLAPYDETYVNAITKLNTTLPNKLKTGTLDKSQHEILASKTFTLHSIEKIIRYSADMFRTTSSAVYPPFAIVPKNAEQIIQMYSGTDISPAKLNDLISFFEKDGLGISVWNEYKNMSYLFMTSEVLNSLNWGEVSRQIGEENPDVLYPIIMDELDEYNAHDEFADTYYGRFTGANNAVFSRAAHLRSDSNSWPNPDEKKLWDTWLGDQNERDGLDVIVGNAAAIDDDKTQIPVQLAVLTPPLNSLVIEEGKQSGDLGSDMGLYVVSNCQQLHAIVHRRMKESLILNNGWGKKTEWLDSTPTAMAVLMEPNNPDALQANLLNFPYNPSTKLPETFTSPDEWNAMYTYIQGVINKMVKPVVNTQGTYDTKHKETLYKGPNATHNRYILQTAINELLLTANANTVDPVPVDERYLSLDPAAEAAFDSSRVSKNLNLGASVTGKIAEALAKPLTAFAAFFEGANAIVYVTFLKYISAIVLFFVLMITPLFMLIGLMIPAHAPGILVTSTLVVAIIKTLPISFMLVDFVMTYASKSFDRLNFLELDKSIMIMVMSVAYTSVVAITLFILFKAGDTSMVISGMSKIDSTANDAGKKLETITRGLAATAVAVGAAAVAGGAGAVMKARSINSANGPDGDGDPSGGGGTPELTGPNTPGANAAGETDNLLGRSDDGNVLNAEGTSSDMKTGEEIQADLAEYGTRNMRSRDAFQDELIDATEQASQKTEDAIESTNSDAIENIAESTSESVSDAAIGAAKTTATTAATSASKQAVTGDESQQASATDSDKSRTKKKPEKINAWKAMGRGAFREGMEAFARTADIPYLGKVIDEIKTSGTEAAAKLEIEQGMDSSITPKMGGFAPSGKLGTAKKKQEYADLLNKYNGTYLEGVAASKDVDDYGRSAKVIADRVEAAPEKNRKRLQKSRLRKRAEVELTLQSKEDLIAAEQSLTGDQFDQPPVSYFYNIKTGEMERKKPDPKKDHVVDPAAKKAISRNAMLPEELRGNEDEIKRVAKAETIKRYIDPFKQGKGKVRDLNQGQQDALKIAGWKDADIKAFVNGDMREMKKANFKIPLTERPTNNMSPEQRNKVNANNRQAAAIHKIMKEEFKLDPADLIPGTEYSVLGAKINYDKATNAELSVQIQNTAIAAGQRIQKLTNQAVEEFGVKDDPAPKLRMRRNF